MEEIRSVEDVCGPWGSGENPLTPLWLVVDASELFALMLMAIAPHTTFG